MRKPGFEKRSLLLHPLTEVSVSALGRTMRLPHPVHKGDVSEEVKWKFKSLYSSGGSLLVTVQFQLMGEWILLLGKDLIGVQNLLKKHQALQAEIAGHEPRIKAVTQKGNAMVEEGECSQ